MKPLLVAASLALFAAAPSPGQVTKTVDRSGRFPIIRVSGEAPRWRLDSIGTLSDSGVGFRDLKGILIDPKGGVLVLDRKAPAIYRFEDAGTLRGIIGRKGSGPKEYDSPNAIGWAGDDLIVFDPGNGRVVRWDRKGEYVTQWTHSRLTGQVPMYSAGPSAVWLLGVAPAAGGKLSRTFIRLPSTGRGDTVIVPVAPNVAGGGADCTAGFDGKIYSFSNPFSKWIFNVRPSPAGGFTELSGSRYRVAVKLNAADTVLVLERVLSPIPISDEEWSDSTKEFREFKAQHLGAGCNGSIARPDRKPEVIDMLVDDAGRIWVERALAKGTLFEIWEGDQLVAAVPGVRRRLGTSDAIDIRGDRVAIARENPDDGGTVVVVYRIVRRE